MKFKYISSAENEICDIFILLRSAPPYSSATPTIALSAPAVSAFFFFFFTPATPSCNVMQNAVKKKPLLHISCGLLYKYKTAMSLSYEQ